jgi:hypothetical protein
MAYRYALAIDFVGLSGATKLRREMGDDLVPVKVKIDPFGARPAFRTAQKLPVKTARGGKVMDRKGKMKGMHEAETRVEAPAGQCRFSGRMVWGKPGRLDGAVTVHWWCMGGVFEGGEKIWSFSEDSTALNLSPPSPGLGRRAGDEG